MDINEIMKLIQAVSDYGLTSFELEEGDVKIAFKREREVSQMVNLQASGLDLGPVVIPQQVQMRSTSVAAPVQAVQDGGVSSDHVVTSPLVGTFYDSSSPEAEVFAKVGDAVKKGQVLGIIEAMKLMNEIESDYDGIVEAVLVNNEDVVEYGQPLFRIR